MGRVATIVVSAAMLAFMLMILASRRAAEPPILRSPVDGAKLVVGSGVPPYEFRWRHGNHLYRHPIRWRRANYFVVCLKEDLPGDFECLYRLQPSNSPKWLRSQWLVRLRSRRSQIPILPGSPTTEPREWTFIETHLAQLGVDSLAAQSR